MKTNEQFGSYDADDDEKDSGSSSSSGSSSTPKESPKHLDMSHGGEHVVELHPRFELSLPAPLLNELLAVKEDDHREAKHPEVPSAESAATPNLDASEHAPLPNDEFMARQTATAEVSKDSDGSGEEDEEETDDTSSSTKKTKPAPAPAGAVPVRDIARSSTVVEQIIDRLDADTRDAFEEAAAAGHKEVEAADIPAPPHYAEHPAAPPAPYEAFSASTADEPPHPPAAVGGMPPLPPTPPTESRAFYYPEPAPEPAPAPADRYAYHPFVMPEATALTYGTAVAPGMSAEQHRTALNQAEYYGEKRGLRRGLVAGFLTGVAVRGWIARRNQRQYEQKARAVQQEQQQQIAELDAAQAHLNERLREQARQIDQYRYQPQLRPEQPAPVAPEQTPLQAPAPATPFEQMAAQAAPSGYEQPAPQVAYTAEQPLQAVNPNVSPLPPLAPRSELRTPTPQIRPEQVAPAPAAVEQQPQNQPGEAIVLQQGQRLEQPGWYSVVRGEDGKVVEGAIQYGEAFKQEQRAEQTPLVTNGQGQQGGLGQDDNAFLGAAGRDQLITSGQVPFSRELSAGYGQRADVAHRLSRSRSQNPVIATLASPWLWAGVVILLLTFFVTALL